MRPDIIDIKPYLHEVNYEDYDYQAAIKFFQRDIPSNSPVLPGCSTVVVGNKMGRNFDWYYTENAEFLTRTFGDPGKSEMKYSTLGIATNIPGLTEEFVKSGEDSEYYGYLPFYTTDGMNSQGLCVSMNVVPAEKGDNTMIKALGKAKDNLCMTMIPRWILDHYATAEEAGNDLLQNYNLFIPRQLVEMQYDLHFMIKDPDGTTYLVEFIDGVADVKDITKYPYMTNFHISGTKFTEERKVYTPADVPEHTPTLDNGVTLSAQGLERYNLISDMVKEQVPIDNMMERLNYTRTYSTSDVPADPFWFTEYVGGLFNVNTPAEDMAEVVDEYGEKFSKRTRNGETSQTVHSCVYDTNETKNGTFTLRLITQEDYTQTMVYPLEKEDPPGPTPVGGETMNYYYPLERHYKYGNMLGDHVIHINVKKDEHDEYTPNKTPDGHPLGINSKKFDVDTGEKFRWNGERWVEDN